MTKILAVGDLHLQKSNLESSGKLFDRIIDLSKCHDATIFLGDLYNNFGVITAEELTVGIDFLSKVKNGILYNGNHDMASDEVHSSLYSLKSVVGMPTLSGNTFTVGETEFGVVDFIRDNSKFQAAIDAIPAHIRTVFCHQEFNGCQYENGFYAKHGALPENFPDRFFISGHIHKVSEFANIFYVGSPHWLTKSDANQERGIWSLAFNSEGILMSKNFISSSDVSPVIYDYHNLDDVKAKLKPEDKVYIQVADEGEAEMALKLTNHVHIRTRPKEKEIKVTVSEARGFMPSVVEYINTGNFNRKEELIKTIEERLRVVS